MDFVTLCNIFAVKFYNNSSQLLITFITP